MCFRDSSPRIRAQNDDTDAGKPTSAAGSARCDQSTRTHMAHEWTGGQVGTLTQIGIYRRPHFP